MAETDGYRGMSMFPFTAISNAYDYINIIIFARAHAYKLFINVYPVSHNPNTHLSIISNILEREEDICTHILILKVNF